MLSIICLLLAVRFLLGVISDHDERSKILTLNKGHVGAEHMYISHSVSVNI